MSFSMILAMDKNRLIGRDNGLPWRLPADLAYFQRKTTGHAVLMGRKTFESLGRPLPNRHNVIITRDVNYRAEGCEVIHSLTEALEAYRDQEVFIIGGSEIYKQALPVTDKLYITWIDHEFVGDAYFPEIDSSEWVLVKDEQGITDERNPYTYYFRVYERKNAEDKD